MQIEMNEIELGDQFIEIIHDTSDDKFRINLMDEDTIMVSRVEIESLPSGKFAISIWDREDWEKRKPDHWIPV